MFAGRLLIVEEELSVDSTPWIIDSELDFMVCIVSAASIRSLYLSPTMTLSSSLLVSTSLWSRVARLSTSDTLMPLIT
jgi:hypothetical protein